MNNMSIIKYIIVIPVALITFLSCDNYAMLVDEPTLEVQAEATECNVGDEIIFSLSSDAEYIYFYSGEMYTDYNYRNGRTVQLGQETYLSFKSALTPAPGNTNKLSVLVTNDFEGDNSSFENIKGTPWVDITSLFTLATNATSVNTSQSITDFINPEEPCYIAFKYENSTQISNGIANKWTIDEFRIVNETDDGVQVGVVNTLNSGFRLLNTHMGLSPGMVVSNTQLMLQGSAEESPDTEHWMVTKPINLHGNFYIGRDKAQIVKKYSDSPKTSFSHTFLQAGVYEVVFVGVNATVEDSKEVVRKIRITVNP
jgi:hypothetical protein